MSFLATSWSTDAAAQAIQDKRGVEFVDALINELTASGLSQREAVFSIVRLLDVYQTQDLEVALALMRHLREWMDARDLAPSALRRKRILQGLL